ncbi:hypothetical protein HA402_010570 [Bradysia odoriphaga]|nr:hypothetical protein HA402_010570 [Bradysia odoriphaga]
MMSETVVTVDPNRQPQAQPKPAAQSQGALSWVKFNIGYFQTIPGILKLVQLVFGIICMACASPAYIGASHWFLFVAVTSFIATLLWSFVYLLGIREVLNLAINWILTELLNTGIATLFYIIAFIVQLATWSNIHPGSYLQYFRASNIAAGVFGIICMACASPAYIGASHWFLFVAVTSFIATLLWSFVYLLGIREVLNLAINWILTELLNTGIATLFYIIAFIVQLATWSNIHPGSYLQYFRASNIAAGCFGLFNTIAYAASTYFLYLEHKSASTP